ncbi:helix-turn-helix transcriptional regulator [Streptomyces sp. NPDC057616]|uniref:helix-turn-helix transcriptional regulator n=1 Tax=Streptomyces sp. NPDC057616 TaxID=3346183 RepID=UPI0036AE4ECE
MESLSFESDDLGATEDFLSRAYARMSIGSTTPDATHTRVTRTGIDAVSIDEIDLSFEMSYSVTPLGKICLCVMHDGTVRDHGFHGVQDDFGPGDVVLFAPPELPYAGRICNARYNITMLDPGLLSQVAGEQSGPPVRLTGHRPHSTAVARQLGRTIAYLRDQVLADPAVAEQPLVASTAAQHLAASVLSAFPSTALGGDAGIAARDERDAHPLILRRALAYIDDHADRPITVAEIAGAAHVTPRALQYAFRRHLDTTPLAHLRQVRLAQAHLDLMAGDPTDGATVTEIAARWGFHHPGRFASLYRDTYHRAPHQTLNGS